MLRMHERNKVHLSKVRSTVVSEQPRIGREPTVGEYLEASRKVAKTAPDGGKRQRGFQSTTEKQKPMGKPPSRDWQVRTGKGGAFVLVHKESGDFYADYVSTPQTSWGAKRFVTVKDAYEYLNNPKNFTQGSRPQSSWNQTKDRGDKVQERVRKQMGYR